MNLTKKDILLISIFFAMVVLTGISLTFSLMYAKLIEPAGLWLSWVLNFVVIIFGFIGIILIFAEEPKEKQSKLK